MQWNILFHQYILVAVATARQDCQNKQPPSFMRCIVCFIRTTWFFVLLGIFWARSVLLSTHLKKQSYHPEHKQEKLWLALDMLRALKFHLKQTEQSGNRIPGSLHFTHNAEGTMIVTWKRGCISSLYNASDQLFPEVITTCLTRSVSARHGG